MISERDEKLHEVGDDPQWSEGMYLNWSDARVFGAAIVEFHPLEGTAMSIVGQVRDGDIEFATGGSVKVDYDELNKNSADGLSVGDVTFRCIEPMNHWRVELEGPNPMSVDFEASTPPFDFAEPYRALMGEAAPSRMEQAGLVSGWTEFKGDRYEFEGVGARDHQWGRHDWSAVEGWNWIAGHFGADISFEATQIIGDGKPNPMGWTFYDGEHRAIRQLDIDYTWGKTEHKAVRAVVSIVDSDGEEFEITGLTRGHLPMVISGAWIQESKADFEITRGPGRGTHGFGVIEHLYRPDVPDLLRRLPELLPVAKAVFWPA